MSRKLLYLAVAIITLTAAATAQATLITYDGLNGYSAGSIVGQNLGTGWTDGWSLSGSGATLTATPTSELTYLDLVTAQGLGTATCSTDAAIVGRHFAAQSSGTLYFSQLMYFSKNEAYQSPDVVSVKGTDGGEVAFSTAWGTAYWNLAVSEDGTGTRTSISTGVASPTAGTTNFVIGKIQFNADGALDVVSLYINPTSLETEPTTADATCSSVNVGTVSNWACYFSTKNNSIGMDEIRIGTTWADVAPVPEPSTLVLLATGLVGLLCYAWRKRK